eukprot:TRINITY_DN7262_c0_g1_i3.p1 TRINITY_DN7262_c0_g1~~TRINITY_DN7262_c0_g1_i3.p1  ORF type:complete len:373 (+),score=93.13 TRINITY_DN7262_c0_g1_i3:313-1431(+)
MYPAYARWIKSHRDLPLMLNQWNSVVRWEFDRPMPFIRSREFLWQEGHSVFATQKEAEDEVMQRLKTYQQAYENLLAVPVIPGTKHSSEKFAGAEYTTSVEGFISDAGRGIQAATSHHLGQIFSKIFDVTYTTKDDTTEHAWQNSWGFSTRSIGVMAMVHGDDKGLVLPPRVAPIQVVVIPILRKGHEEEVYKAVERIEKLFEKSEVRLLVDRREHLSPGFKYNDWELKGVPLRIDVGAREANEKNFPITLRTTNKKITSSEGQLRECIEQTLEEIQTTLLENERAKLNENVRTVTNWTEFMSVLNDRKLALAQWCGHSQCEAQIKKSCEDSETKVKHLNIPFEFKDKPFTHENCFACESHAKMWILYGKSY